LSFFFPTRYYYFFPFFPEILLVPPALPMPFFYFSSRNTFFSFLYSQLGTIPRVKKN